MKYLLIPALAIALAACKPKHQQLAEVTDLPSAVPVKIAPIAITDQIQPIQAVGTLGSAVEFKESFKIGGVIDRIYVDAGDRFVAGQVLARLEMKEIDAQVRKAKEGVDKYERDADRVGRLYEDTVATLEQFQDIGTALELARADLEIAAYNQQYAQIIARRPGRVLKRLAEPGELVSPGVPILFSRSEGQAALVLKVGLSDRDMVRVAVGDSARVRFDAWPDASFAGEVRDIAPQADPMTGTFEVEVSVEPGKYPLRPGFLGQVRLYPGNDRRYYQIPMEAIVSADDRAIQVFLADTTAHSAHRHILSLAHIQDDCVLVDTVGQSLGNPLVVAGGAYLSESASITIQ